MTLLASLQMQTQQGQPRHRTRASCAHHDARHVSGRLLTLGQLLHPALSQQVNMKLYIHIHVDCACLYEQLTAAGLHLAQPDHPACKLCLDHQRTMQGDTSRCSWNRGKAAGGVQSQAMLL